MHDEEKLSRDLVWQADGHLTEIAITAMADGEQAILPQEAVAHANACDACADALGKAALLSLRAGEALREMGGAGVVVVPAPITRPAEAPEAPKPPIAAIGAAVLLAAIGAAPAFVADARRLPETWAQIERAMTVVLHTGHAVAASGAIGARGWISLLLWVSAAVLVLAGLGVSRIKRNELNLGGGV